MRGGASNAGDAFSLIGAALYNRFEQEDAIDSRILKAFIDSIDNAPEQTHDERSVVEKIMAKGLEIKAEAKRIAGTVQESVDKFTVWQKGASTAWAWSKAVVDVSAEELIARLWVLTTHRVKVEHVEQNGELPRAVWENIDGSRSVQYTKCVRFPQGMSHRYFESWFTWEARSLKDGRKELILAFVPMNEYNGTHHNLKGTDGMIKGSTKGVYVVKELTKSTCEWIWIQVRTCEERSDDLRKRSIRSPLAANFVPNVMNAPSTLFFAEH